LIRKFLNFIEIINLKIFNSVMVVDFHLLLFKRLVLIIILIYFYALLGRMPSAVGYQPTLATEMGGLQERITSTKEGSITSIVR
jgi:hypothetical protein